MARRSFALFLLILTMSSPAAAHVGIGTTSGLAAGLLHPFFGIDHILAMVMIGVWASTLAGARSGWCQRHLFPRWLLEVFWVCSGCRCRSSSS